MPFTNHFYLVEEKLERFLRELGDVKNLDKITDSPTKLSVIVETVYKAVFHSSLKLDSTCKEIFDLKFLMFQAKFERKLFLGLIKHNDDIKYTGADKPSAKTYVQALPVPLSFRNQNFNVMYLNNLIIKT